MKLDRDEDKIFRCNKCKKKLLRKKAHESLHRNKTQEEIEKYEVLKLDRAEDKFLKCNRCKKVWRQKKDIKVQTEIKHRKKSKKKWSFDIR